MVLCTMLQNDNTCERLTLTNWQRVACNRSAHLSWMAGLEAVAKPSWRAAWPANSQWLQEKISGGLLNRRTRLGMRQPCSWSIRLHPCALIRPCKRPACARLPMDPLELDGVGDESSLMTDVRGHRHTHSVYGSCMVCIRSHMHAQRELTDA